MKYESDITGNRYGMLTAIKPVPRKNGRLFWLFRCDCGTEKEINKNSVMRGKVVACGCFRLKRTIEQSRTHGETETRLYQCWRDMKVRCLLKTCKNYKNYGGRGITICSQWKDDYETFSSWSKLNGYSDNLTLDRIDVNGNYCPENCRWITQKEQAKNKRNNRKITFDKKTMILSDWLRFFGFKSTSSFSYYKKKGFSDTQILTLFKNKRGVP